MEGAGKSYDLSEVERKLLSHFLLLATYDRDDCGMAMLGE